MKIRHAGFLHSRDKMKRIAAVCEQLKLPAPMPRVSIPVILRLMIQTGRDVTLCPRCGKGHLSWSERWFIATERWWMQRNCATVVLRK